MYLAFDLYDIQHLHNLNAALHAWSDRFDITYNTKTVRNIKRVTFDADETYTFFAMTWDHEHLPFSLIDQNKIDNP
jgi:hypothetical protein